MTDDTTRRTYSDDEKAEALAAYAEVGPAEAARRTGIPSATIRKWAQRAGVTGDDPRTRLATEAAKTKWAARRDELANQAGAAAALVLEAMVVAAHNGDGANARGLAVAFGVTVDKAQLMSGGATSRDQLDVSTPEARLALVQDLTSRRPPPAAEQDAG